MAIWTGSTAICRHIAAWIRVAPVPRLLLVALVLGFVNGLVSAGHIAAVLAASWLGTAVVLGLRLPPPAPPAADPATDLELLADSPPPSLVLPAEPPELLAAELVRALHEVGAHHAHLAALADHLGTTTERVRAGLKAAGIPAGDQVRMRGRGVSTGVRAAHFPPLPAPTPPVVAAGHADNNDNNNSPGARGFTTEPDAVNPHRTWVRWPRSPREEVTDR